MGVVNANIPLTRISIYQVLGSALYYNPQLQLAELEKREVTQQVFQKWMADAETKDMSDRWLPRKLTVLGLSSLLALPAASLPVSIQSSLPPLIDAMIRMTISLKKDSEGGDMVAHDNNLPEDDERDDDMAKFLLGGDWDESEDVDEDFTSPLDRVDELLFLNDTLKAAFQREPEAYQQVQAALSPESVANCQKLFLAADQMRAQAAQQSTQQS